MVNKGKGEADTLGCSSPIWTAQFSFSSVARFFFHRGSILLKYLKSRCVLCLFLQILVLELNDEAAEQTVEAKDVDLLQGQEGFRWKVMNKFISHSFINCNVLLITFKSLVSYCACCHIFPSCYSPCIFNSNVQFDKRWFKSGFLSIRATLGWMCERSRCFFLQAFSLSVWSSASLPPWSLPSPCIQSGSWWLLAPVTALACMTTSRRTTSLSSKRESTFYKQDQEEVFEPFCQPCYSFLEIFIKAHKFDFVKSNIRPSD